MLIVLLILAPILFILHYEMKYKKIRKQIKHTPGPPILPMLGNAHQVGKSPNDILHSFFNWFYQYGNFSLWIGYLLNYVVTDIKDMEFVLTSQNLLAKSQIYDVLHPWLGDGLLTSHGKKWHTHRKMITPSFHFKILQDFHGVMSEKSTKFMEKLREVSKGAAIFDIQKEIHYLVLDIICDTAMGVSINAMENPQSEFVSAMDFLCSNACLRMFHPLKIKLFTYKFYPEYKTYCKNLNTVKDFLYNVIGKRIELRQQEERNESLKKSEDEFAKRKFAFLDNLLSTTIDGRPLTREELYEEVATFMFTGQETISAALSFASFLLSRHKDIQKKVLEEQELVMGGNMKGNATFQELSEMNYLNLVFKETLRLYPSAPVVGRIVKEDLHMNGKLIPAGSSILLFIMAMGYNEKIFPDPYRFQPERFDIANRAPDSNPFEYVPFSAGLRNCIGQNFAKLEFKTVLSKLVRNFEILPAQDELESKDGNTSIFFGPYRKERSPMHKYDPILSPALTLRSENGVHLRLRER
uniref:Cytochrome P450 n=1 Tax=Stomoxys calcitrans TaxID=35570 RepID=A0A1I8PNV9_STOCA